MRRIAMAAAFVLAMALPVSAQEINEVRFYIVPKIGDGLTPQTALRPKYIEDIAPGITWYAMDYGREDSMLVGVEFNATQHTTITANLDVTAIPSVLDSTVSSAALATIQSKLEGLKIPGSWVTTSHTYRQVVGTVGRIFMLMQRFDGLHARSFFQSGITLNTRMNQLTAPQRADLLAAATSFGLDTSFIVNTTTVRTVLQTWVQQMGSFTLAGEIF